jgi:signal transduction histidine kinase
MTHRIAAALRAWSRWPALQDVAPAGVLLAGCVVVNNPGTTLHKIVGSSLPAPWLTQPWMWWTATLITVAGVALRRRWPVPMLALCVLAVGAHLAHAAPLMIIDFGVPILLYTVASRYRQAVSFAVLAGLLLLAAAWSVIRGVAEERLGRLRTEVDIVAAVDPDTEPLMVAQEPIVYRLNTRSSTWSHLSVVGSALVASWAIGFGTRSRRALLDELRAHARDVEHERDQQAALVVAAERGRISRELHDVVAHGLSVIVIQAQGGTAALDSDPADTRTALEAIVTVGRDSLAEMRRVLAAVGEQVDPWHPQPGLAQLPILVAQVRKVGTPVRLRIEGTPTSAAPTVDLSAYRIIQEALTNTMKHAGPGARAQVLLAYDERGIRLEISDDGRGVASTGQSGNGLRGMRERTTLLGEELTAKPGPEGGFVVRATCRSKDQTHDPRSPRR